MGFEQPRTPRGRGRGVDQVCAVCVRADLAAGPRAATV